jgi:D-alanine--poly(phosphoribitol) ligase subunit 2
MGMYKLGGYTQSRPGGMIPGMWRGKKEMRFSQGTAYYETKPLYSEILRRRIKQIMRTKKIMSKCLSWMLTLTMLLSMIPGMAFAAEEAAEEPTEGYILVIYNEDGTEAMTINGSKSASEFNLGTALEDAYVFGNNAFLFGITGTPTYEVVLYEDEVLDERDIDLFEEEILDSMAAIELLVALKSEFGITIAPTELDREEMNTVNKIAARVSERL